jgi:hypothetical protein
LTWHLICNSINQQLNKGSIMKYLILVAALALTSCMDRKIQATVQGAAGTNGSSCSTHQMENGAIVSCTDGTSSVIYNGVNGLNGSSGILGPIFPCGKEFANDEVFLRLSDGSILAVYDGGNFLSRLVLIAPGSYITTDRTGVQCQVRVDSNLNVTTSPTAATGAALR